MSIINVLQNAEREDSHKTRKILKMRNRIINYLYSCGFVQNYVKKLLFSDFIDEYYEDYVQETWLQLCEVKEEKWFELMENNDNAKHDEFYSVRNWVSMLIKNTVRSTTSTAYRKLLKQSTVTKRCDDNEWKELSNTVEDKHLRIW